MPLEPSLADALPGPREPHVVAGFQGVEPQPVPEWCWAAVCKAVAGWRGQPLTLCDVVKRVKGTACARGGPDCQAPACRRPERLRRALEVLAIPFREPSPGESSWSFCLEALASDHLVACQILTGGLSHAVILSSVAGASSDGAPVSVGVSDPYPVPEIRRSRFYETGFRPRFVAAIAR